MNTHASNFIALAALSAAFTGCATCEPVLVPVTVPCKPPEVERPIMPTEWLATFTLDGFVQAAAAEIERREAYEMQLRAALDACK